MIVSINTLSEVFKMMHWSGSQLTKMPLSLIFGGDIILDQKERDSILRDSLLARHGELDEIPLCKAPSNATMPWADELTNEEVRTCTTECDYKSPRPDRIAMELLTAAWDIKGYFIVQILRACIGLGTYSSCSKQTEVTLLQNLGQDPFSVESWRPIVLLPCI